MIAVDTSVVVAAFASWHEGHRAASAALRRDVRVPAHVLLETYSVLTRLPPPHRSPASLVAAWLAERFAAPPLVLPPLAHLRLVQDAADADLRGGTIHDAFIAATARHAGLGLLTRDRRALPTYSSMGVDAELVE